MNLDTVNSIGVKINSSTQFPLAGLSNYGDTYPLIDRVELVNLGGTPSYTIILHG